MKLIRKIILVITIVWNGNVIYAQNSENFFKTMPLIDHSTPKWAKQMYSDNPNINEVKEAYEEYYRQNSFKKNIHTQNYKHWLVEIRSLLDADGYIKTNQIDKVANKYSNKQVNVTETGSWTNLGPYDTYRKNKPQSVGSIYSKQVNVYLIEPSLSHQDILYAGNQGGVVYRTDDNGVTWRAISNHSEMIGGIGGLAVHPNNPDIVFVGAEKSGVFKTKNGGVTWTKVSDIKNMTTLEIDHEKPRYVLVGTDEGLYRSSDFGNNWTQVLSEKCWDIEYHPTDSRIVYALRKNESEKRSDLYKSTDRGLTWVLKNQGWYQSTQPLSGRNDGGGRIATTPADPNLVLVLVGGQEKQDDNTFISIFKSVNAGETWVNLRDYYGGPYTADDFNLAGRGKINGGAQGFYNLDIEISDTNPDKIFQGGIHLNQSLDGGLTWERMDWINYHVDIQDIEVDGDEVWVANDGGIEFSEDGGQSAVSRKNGITGSSYWGLASGWNEDVLVGGRYHNGNGVYYERYPQGLFTVASGVESHTGYVNPGNNRKTYFSDAKGRIIPEDYTQAQERFSNIGMFPNEGRAGKRSSMYFDPRYYEHVLIGYENKLWKSIDGAVTYSILREFGTNPKAKITSIEISRSNPNVIYCAQNSASGATGGKIWKTINGGVSWMQISNPPHSRTSGMVLQLSPEDENTLWVALTKGNNGSKLYKTIDGGNSWQNLTTSLLDDEVIVDILVQGGTDGGIYLATDFKVFYRDNSMSEWSDFSQGLPFYAKSNILKPFYRDNKIRLATLGKGIWESPMYESSEPVAQPMVQTDYIAAGDTLYFDDYSILNHANATWQWQFPGATYIESTSMRNPRVVYNSPGSYDVILTVDDGIVSSSKTIIGMVEVIDGASFARVTGVVKDKNKKLIIYPNPLLQGNVIKLAFDGSEKLKIQLFDDQGKFVLERKLEAGQKNIEIGSLKSGIYLYNIQGETFINNGKIIVE